ncbi:hypothetical protein SERLADRAFT_444166 [Serpula lacrymans var. lacrymans S7.9]|uniref:Uncharacterized protein n=1 Tax=Serpula lacrymans var. lacrymans (strain S7.9) TaxID=578457 RepID=F8PEP7_SERL9|nr:uncharacterized protein SERLADRAFT_444166 [Serpula lacrymans var. lacrymans S7.9]EGO18400.1 hypothetical protein SERLADRAFT_444166 [Serpula lacrymans var. lacrymans S7.9]
MAQKASDTFFSFQNVVSILESAADSRKDGVLRSMTHFQIMSPSNDESTHLEKDTIGVPKLKPNGSNWSIYRMRFEWALADRDCVEHLLGTAPKPTPTPPAAAQSTQASSGTTVAPVSSKEDLDALNTWSKKEY